MFLAFSYTGDLAKSKGEQTSCCQPCATGSHQSADFNASQRLPPLIVTPLNRGGNHLQTLGFQWHMLCYTCYIGDC